MECHSEEVKVTVPRVANCPRQRQPAVGIWPPHNGDVLIFEMNVAY